ncbi:MAG TPA: DUF4340 domain-containing protein [Candidatus Acidoferrales bacterium]|nr:DUF4340 domain-containing protein [Candidatus Acidoferrales bacterium]
MIKKPTLILLLCAIILGVAVYYFDYRKSLNAKPADTEKLAFTLQPSDITSLTLSFPAKPSTPAIHFTQQKGTWQITQPIETGADQPSLQSISNAISNARISQTEPGTPDRLSAFGLSTPAVSVEFQLQDGKKHSLLLGNKDFTGIYAYAIVDGAKDVSLLPESLLVSVDKSLDDLRDRAVLHITGDSVASFELKNKSGELAASKEKDVWKFSKPAGPLADSDNVTSLLGAVANAKVVDIKTETPEDLAKYGLASPAITFTAVDNKGAKFTLLVGKKDGDDYFARDTGRPMIFRIDDATYKKLSDTFADLRDMKLVHFDVASLQSIEVKNSNGGTDLTRKSEDEWTINAPAAEKGKSASIWKITSPLIDARADEVLDHPAASITSQLAKPAIEVDLTDKSGQMTTIRISKPSGDFIYAQTSGNPAVYKLKKDALDGLDFKPADIGM